MPEFIRVRQAEGPAHEFDAALEEVRQHPELYVVIDETPVTEPRAPEYSVTESHAKAPKAPRASRARPAAKPPTPEASVGQTTEGEG